MLFSVRTDTLTGDKKRQRLYTPVHKRVIREVETAGKSKTRLNKITTEVTKLKRKEDFLKKLVKTQLFKKRQAFLLNYILLFTLFIYAAVRQKKHSKRFRLHTSFS